MWRLCRWCWPRRATGPAIQSPSRGRGGLKASTASRGTWASALTATCHTGADVPRALPPGSGRSRRDCAEAAEKQGVGGGCGGGILCLRTVTSLPTPRSFSSRSRFARQATRREFRRVLSTMASEPRIASSGLTSRLFQEGVRGAKALSATNRTSDHSWHIPYNRQAFV